MPETSTKTHITHVGNLGIPVSDQDRAVDFYVDKLGFEKHMDVPFGNGMRWVDVGPPGAVTTIALLPPQSGLQTGVDTNIRLMTKNADADHADMRSRGVDVDAEVMRLGDAVPPMFGFRDADGNKLYIVEMP